MRRKAVGIGILALVAALVLTLMPACGKGGGGEVKTLKIGILTPLSGPASAWGVPHEEGAKWARDVINEDGGFKVGEDTYTIELISVDGAWMPSKMVEGASKLVYDEQVHYALMLGPVEPTLPIFHEGKTFTLDITAVEATLSTQLPYSLQASTLPIYWERTWYASATEFQPDVRTVAIVKQNDATGQEWMIASKEEAEAAGLRVVAQEFFEAGTVDFYPMLTKVLAKNPDTFELCGLPPGLQPLIVKQARELGYTGKFWSPCQVPLNELLQTVSCDAVSSHFASNEPNYTSAAFSQATRNLYREFVQRYKPEGDVMRFVVVHGYASVMFYVQAIQKAKSIDPDKVMKVIDDSNWTFDWFGEQSKLGGVEAYGVRRVITNYQAYSEIQACEVVTKANRMMTVP